MSAINTVQLTSIPFKPRTLFPDGFQALGDATLTARPASLGKPVQILGADDNPIGVVDNTIMRATSILLCFAGTANSSNLIFDLTGFSQIEPSSGIYIPTLFFSGGGAVNAAAIPALGAAAAGFVSTFTKTFAGSNMSYIEPSDGVTAGLLICDIRGYDYLAIRIAKGAATAAGSVQVYFGVN